MILKARDDFDLNLGESILIGDKEPDILAGIEAGVGTKVLVKSGHAIAGNSQANFIIDSVKQLPGLFGLK
jgi:D-glycero-D-manno-heptose 1,7-bisphosphate phosphatase